MSKNLVIDKSKCVSCGLCIKDCISHSLEFDKDRKPCFAPGGEKRCIECQHCLAVCPAGAVSILGKMPEASESLLMPDSKVMLDAIKYRRSTRLFKQETVSPEIIDKLKSALNYTPTGCNDHRLLFSITETKQETDKIREYVIQKLVQKLRFIPFIGPVKKFAHYKKILMSGNDVIFRNAPHIIVAASPINAPCSDIDPVIALSYFELYAASLGLGTCWCGFAQACFKILPELKTVFNLPQEYKPVYAMLFGIPDIKYGRTTQPVPFGFVRPNIAFIK